MAVGLHVLKNFGDLAFAINQEGSPGDSLYFLPIHVLFLDNAEGLGDFFVGVGEQVVGEVVFPLEFFLGGRSVGGNS